jgi:plastocyanin
VTSLCRRTLKAGIGAFNDNGKIAGGPMDSKQNIVAACSAFLLHKSEVLIATTFATAALLGAVVGSVLAAGVLFVRAADSSNTVSIDNFIFTPKALTVKAGTSVTWTNHDDIPHGIASSDNAFKRSAALDTDDSYSFTFTAPGTYQYFCYIHSFMVGTIVVEAATGSNATR